jgi:hypothetical protein
MVPKDILVLAMFSLSAVVPGSAAAAEPERAPAMLPNGLRLPNQWPPRPQSLTREPMEVPCLKSPPAVIPIDVGRQLFVDDFLIDRTTLRRTFHQAEYHPACPVLKPDRPWEREGALPTAMVFSDGVWFDPADGLFKMWYMGGYTTTTCYATSKDGIRWEKPSLDVEPGTNIVLRQGRDSVTVWLDLRESDLKRRFKMFAVQRDGRGWVVVLRVSADGIHWSKPLATSPPTGDRTTVFYNPFRGVWVYSLRSDYSGLGRTRRYREHPDAVAGLAWRDSEPVLWVGADRLDPHNPNPELRNVAPQLYNLDAVAYESLIVGLFSIWQGDPAQRGFQKRNEVLLGFSRDGFHWHRPDRRPFAGVNESDGAWNWANVQSAGGGCLVVGDKLYFYVSGRQQSRKTGHNTTGLAILRRDGFASMDAGSDEGTLTTRAVRFGGKHLFVNLVAPKGELRVELLDDKGRVLEPFTRANCTPSSGDSTLAEVKWSGADDLSSVSGKAVRFRFHLRSGSLYSFWVSPDRSGASHGYVAAGGPGLTGPMDTAGQTAYAAARKLTE